jgi:hypothetical protein
MSTIAILSSLYHSTNQSQQLFWNWKNPSAWSDGGLPFLCNKGEEYKMNSIIQPGSRSFHVSDANRYLRNSSGRVNFAAYRHESVKPLNKGPNSGDFPPFFPQHLHFAKF